MKRGIFAVAIFGLFIGQAVAHSTLTRSDPKDGAVLQHAPNELRMWFSEPLKVGLTTIEVRNARDHVVDGHDLHADQKTPTLLLLSLPPALPAGSYKVSWSAVAQDMHVTKGAFTFQVAP